MSTLQRLPRPPVVRRRKLGLGITILVLIAGAATAFLVLPPRSGSPGWTGAAVRVPACPTDVDGCRVFVEHASDGTDVAGAPVVGDNDWSGGASVLKITPPAGNYAISAQGCTGDQIANMQISVTSGFDVDVDMVASWEMPKFLGRACPGFGTARPLNAG